MRNSKNKRKARYPKLPKFQTGGPLSSKETKIGEVSPNTLVESRSTLGTRSKENKGKENVRTKYTQDQSSTYDDGSRTSMSTKDITKARTGKKSKSRNKTKFTETDASGNLVSKEVSRTNKRGVTRARGFTTDYETGKKRKYSGKYKN